MSDFLLLDNESRIVKLPEWLDTFVFCDLQGVFAPCKEEMRVLEWQADRICIYTGTYFPRSFAEANCIFNRYFQAHKEQYTAQVLNILDLGCGTGGELIGLLCSLRENLPFVSDIHITAIDGNRAGLRLLERIIAKFQEFYNVELDCKFGLLTIEDINDLQDIIKNLKLKFDIALSFKAIGEFVSQFYPMNPYEHFIDLLLKSLDRKGILCLADVPNFNLDQNNWLPNLMNSACVKLNCKTIYMNRGNVEIFRVSHSQKDEDTSKIAWRILEGG